MTFIEKFVNKVRTEENSFVLNDGDKFYYFFRFLGVVFPLKGENSFNACPPSFFAHFCPSNNGSKFPRLRARSPPLVFL